MGHCGPGRQGALAANIPCDLVGGGGGLLEGLRAAGPQTGKPGHMAGPGSGTTCFWDCMWVLPGCRGVKD